MAIYQISQITNRKGLQIDLPQLAGAELGWSIDERRLWIGNGTLAEGAPVVGNTEILTEFSDIFALPAAYTYKGEAAGYQVQTGPTPGSPVKLSFQSWMDQWASVKDFGAMGDGVTDDTAAINRALAQLFCVSANPAARRSLFFPAGVYLISDSINIPPYARLYGEGAESSIIRLAAASGVLTVAQTADSAQQTGPAIGTGGATPPQFISIAEMCFQSQDVAADIMRIDATTDTTLSGVAFIGPLGAAELNTSTYNTAGVRFSSTPVLVTSNVVFNDCVFAGTTWAATTVNDSGEDEQVAGVTFDDSAFGWHYQAIVLGTGSPVLAGGPSGVRIVNSMFDNIYAEGVVFGACQLNATGHNIFYDVGNHFQGSTQPYTAVIDIQSDNNVSVGDLFERTDVYARFASPGVAWPRVTIGSTTSIAITGSSQIAVGSYVRQTGQTGTLADNTLTPTVITAASGDTLAVYVDNFVAFSVDYTIVRADAYRTGTLRVASNSSLPDLNWSDSYDENKTTGINLTVTQTLDVVSVVYTSTATGQPATITYSLTHLA